MDINIYDTLERLYKLEEQSKEKDLDPKELGEYHRLSFDFLLLSLDDVLGYRDYLKREFDERLEDAVKENEKDLRKRFRRLAFKFIKKRTEILEKRLEQKLLHELEQRCSPSAYQEVQAIIERHFNNPSR